MIHSDMSLRLAKWTENIVPSAMQTSLAFADEPNFISLALGLPDCNLFPKYVVEEAIKEIISESTVFQYKQPINLLKEQITSLMAVRGVVCKENEIFLTAGAQQSISLLVRMLLNYNSSVILENVVYPGFIQAIEQYSPKIYTVSTHLVDGIVVDEIEASLKKRLKPALIYLVPDGSNPHAATIPLKHRQRLAELAKYYCVPILEDDPYGFLNYDDNRLPPIKSFDSEWVFYIGTFSKLLAPSFRVGWLVIPEKLHSYLAILKEGSDINTATFSQTMVSKILEKIKLLDHIHLLIDSYKTKRAMLSWALQEYFPKQIVYHLPANGIFFWVKLPECVDINELYICAVKNYQVAFIPGEAFAIIKNTSDKHFIRLNFSMASVEQIREGILRLSKALKDQNNNGV